MDLTNVVRTLGEAPKGVWKKPQLSISIDADQPSFLSRISDVTHAGTIPKAWLYDLERFVTDFDATSAVVIQKACLILKPTATLPPKTPRTYFREKVETEPNSVLPGVQELLAESVSEERNGC